ncbi:MAG: GIY-YIG nuclease family protein [Candidatus Aminicenantes bacterium]|nr:GIY-YIG nuclease family protein [Candidatus Aminicenantes bacterium]
MILKLDKRWWIKVGRLPATCFEPGYYVYVGRAKRGLKGRIQRHLKKNKKIFWHIDYLTHYAQILNVLIKPGAYDECRTVRKLRKLIKDSAIPLRGFGASDCRCLGHLLYLPALTSIKNLEELLFQTEGFKGLN